MKQQSDPFSDDGRKSPFDALGPDLILQAVEQLGFEATGELIQLNSYENRVFEVKTESDEAELHAPQSVIVKFYRPGRWSFDTISEEHRFLIELRNNDIPAICPFSLNRELPSSLDATTVLSIEGFLVAVFPKARARMPDEFLPGDLREIGKVLARLHNVGAQNEAHHRPILTSQTYGDTALERLESWVFPDLWPRYLDASEFILDELDRRLKGVSLTRIHGDCHRGNILKSDPSMAQKEAGVLPSFFFVDFDDFCMGPEVQDFFMLLSSRLTAEASAQNELDEILSGYKEFRKVPKGLNAIEALRGLRVIHYSGWIAARWSDPAFRPLLPDFNTYEWWLDETQRLEEIADSL